MKFCLWGFGGVAPLCAVAPGPAAPGRPADPVRRGKRKFDKNGYNRDMDEEPEDNVGENKPPTKRARPSTTVLATREAKVAIRSDMDKFRENVNSIAAAAKAATIAGYNKPSGEKPDEFLYLHYYHDDKSFVFLINEKEEEEEEVPKLWST